MASRTYLRINIALVGLMTLAGWWALRSLPTGARIPIHFNAAGAPDGWAPALYGLFLIPLTSLVLLLIQRMLPAIDPRGENLRRSAKAYGVIFVAVMLLMLIVQGALIASALGHSPDVSALMFAALGLLWIAIGNMFGKLQWNYTVGIRTPWTLQSPTVWDRTHRFGGRVFVGTGLLMLLAAFCPIGATTRAPLLIALTLGGPMLVAVRSYFYWRDESGQTAPGG